MIASFWWLRVSARASECPPYRIAGTFPARRRRRLAPLPWVSRNSASSSKEVFIIFSSCITNTAARAPRPVAKAADQFNYRSIDVQRAHRLLIADAPYRFGEQSRHTQLANALAGPAVVGERDRIRHHQFVQNRPRNAFDRG